MDSYNKEKSVPQWRPEYVPSKGSASLRDLCGSLELSQCSRGKRDMQNHCPEEGMSGAVCQESTAQIPIIRWSRSPVGNREGQAQIDVCAVWPPRIGPGPESAQKEVHVSVSFQTIPGAF